MTDLKCLFLSGNHVILFFYLAISVFISQVTSTKCLPYKYLLVPTSKKNEEHTYEFRRICLHFYFRISSTKLKV